MRAVAVAAVAVAVGAGCGGGTDADGSEAAQDAAVEATAERTARAVERLREGGLVVAFRHAATDSGMDTTDDLSDCSRQRNLSAAGRRAARAIGEAFRRLEIPVGRVLASPFCRTRDTARIAFGRVRPSRALLSVEFLDDPDAYDRGPAALKQLIGARPRRDANTILVSHGSAIDEATGVNPEEGEAVVLAPAGAGRGFDVVARVKPAAWRGLAAD